MPSECTCQIAVIRQGVREALLGAFGQVRQQEVCTRAAHRGVSDLDHIRLCVTPVGLRVWIVKAPTTRDRVESRFPDVIFK